mmetsp:Transcript_12122/g.18169  ORF Transcript_12122/g.18169 Transcript_12122/m.18169 type:complete len:1027 (-) Transcript_12122:131-3211(-)
MSSFFPERANIFIDDHIVTPLLAKENEEANKITETYKYDPESNLTTTTLETSVQSDYGAHDPDGHIVKNYNDDTNPRSCCQRLKSAIMILLAAGNTAAWVLSFVYTPFGTSSWHSVLIFVTGGICLITTLMMVVNERRILSYPANLIEMVCEAQTYRRELKLQVKSLREETHYLMQRATRCEAAEIQLREVAESDGYSADELLQMVKNNEKTLDLLRAHKRERVTEEVVRIVLKDGSPIINEATAKSLAREICEKLEEMNVLFDEDKFIQALASNPTLVGAISAVKKLLPDEDYNHEKDDAHDMFHLSNEDKISQGSVYAARARLDGKQVSLAQRLKKVKVHYSGGSGDGKSSTVPDDEDEDPERPRNVIREALRQFGIMAIPYFREDRNGRCLFGTLFVITLVNNALNVYFSYMIRDFYNALTEKHVAEFYHVFVRYVGSMIIAVPIQVSYRYMYTKIGIAWRKWLTERVLTLYFSNRVFYGLESQGNRADGKARDYKERQTEVDNPDQRIQEDVSSFTSYSLSFFLTIVGTVIDLVSFSIILFSVMPQLFIAIIVFATLGTAATIIIGKVLVRLNYEALQREADFRFSLVRIRENAESIAFYGGEPVEEKEVKQKFQRAIDNSNLINVAQRNLDIFITSYNHLTEILPTIILANQYFNGIIEFGVVAQVRGAFWHILNDFSVIIREFNGIASFMAGLDRLFLFMKAIQKLDPDRPKDDTKVMMKDMSPPDEDDRPSSQHVIRVKEVRASDLAVNASTDRTQPSTILTMRDVRLVTPDNKRVLVENLDISLLRGRNLLIAGVSGSGKSSLLRAIAGLWSNGSGEIVRPSSDQIYFLPQRPYCPPGSLRDQLLYPSTELSDNYDGTQDGWSRPIEQRRVEWSSMSDEELLDVLVAVDLPGLASRIGDGDPIRGLNTVLDYSNTLSLGEQQRLAFGRLVINRPSLVVLDESTSALDVVAERKMYTLLKNIAADAEDGGRTGLTYISVGHRPTLLQHHDVKLLLRDGGGSVSFIQQTESSAEEQTILT